MGGDYSSAEMQSLYSTSIVDCVVYMCIFASVCVCVYVCVHNLELIFIRI